MRCHYLSDLHLESQSFDDRLPSGDVLILAGDICHARCLDPARTDRYSIEQRGRVRRFIDGARTKFAHVLLVPGNHEHYEGVFEDTAGLLRKHLPGVAVLDGDTVELDGTTFFGATLWTDFAGRDAAAMEKARRGMGEYFFVRTRWHEAPAEAATRPPKLRPADTLKAHETAWAALRDAAKGRRGPLVVVTHHPPSLKGANPRFAGNGLDPAYASDHDGAVAALPNVTHWVHGHTHIARSYSIGGVTLHTNALGFAAKGQAARGFSVKASFEV